VANTAGKTANPISHCVRWQLFPYTIEEKNNVKARIIAAHAMIIIWMDLHPHLRIFIQPPPFPIGNRCLTIEIEWRRNMSENEYGREIGKRIKKWGIAGDISRHIEGTAEYPIMYRALGTNPQKKHPFNLYGDIKNQGEALRGTFKANSDVIPEIARILVDKDFSGMVGHGLGTSHSISILRAASLSVLRLRQAIACCTAWGQIMFHLRMTGLMWLFTFRGSLLRFMRALLRFPL
jgi:hypothetical protein